MEPYLAYASFLPILILLAVSLWRGVRVAIYAALLTTMLLYVLGGGGWAAFGASLVNALFGSINILMIIFGALLLYQVMEQRDYLRGIQDSLQQVHPDRQVRLFFLVIFMTAFFESVAGFGTPGAIVPLLLISLGYSAGLSIALVLLIDGLFAVSGAVGTPVIAGLETPLGLESATIGRVYAYGSVAVALSGLVIMGFVYRYLRQESDEGFSWTGWKLFAAIMLPYLLLAPWLRELTGVVAAVILGAFAYAFVFQNWRISWQPWVPYWVLVGLLLLPKLMPPFGELLTYELALEGLFGTEVSASLQPLRSPLVPFALASVYALFRAGNFQLNWRPVYQKTLGVFLILFPSLAITQLMLNSGGEGLSMIGQIEAVFVQSGGAYPLFSPLIGVLGAFMTGSTTVSNIIFGPIQYGAAQQLALEPGFILGIQLAGASLGNAVCLFNIIAAAAVVGMDDFKGVLKRNLWPILLACLVLGALSYAWVLLGT